MTKIKPKLTGNSVNEFTTPTLEELPAEYQQAYEALKKSRGEEYLQEYVKCLPPSSNYVGPSTILKQEGLQANQQERVHSANMVDSVETESNMNKSSTAESNDSFKEKMMVDSVETRLSTETVTTECIESIPSTSYQPSASTRLSTSCQSSASF